MSSACSTQTYICSSKNRKSCAAAQLFFCARFPLSGKRISGAAESRFVFRIRMACGGVSAFIRQSIRRTRTIACAAFTGELRIENGKRKMSVEIYVYIPFIRTLHSNTAERADLTGTGSAVRKILHFPFSILHSAPPKPQRKPAAELCGGFCDISLFGYALSRSSCTLAMPCWIGFHSTLPTRAAIEIGM